MLRAVLCVAIGLFVCGDAALAKAASKKGKTATSVSGKISKVDADGATLSVSVSAGTKGKKESSDKQFTISDSTKFAIIADGKTTNKTGKDGLTDRNVKAGAAVKVTTDSHGVVTSVEVGSRPNASKKKSKQSPA